MATEALKEVVSRVVQNLEEKNRNVDILKTWEKAVGKKIAKHTKPISLKKGVMVINVDRIGWLFELNMLRPFILKKLKKFSNLESLKFRIGKV